MVEMMVTPVTTSLEHPGEETQWRLKESASFCNCLQVNKQTKATTNNTHTKKPNQQIQEISAKYIGSDDWWEVRNLR